jgi:hypothetical protein
VGLSEQREVEQSLCYPVKEEHPAKNQSGAIALNFQVVNEASYGSSQNF